MPRKHYSPRISRFLVRVLYYESKRRKMPMTQLTDELLRKQFMGSEGWNKAEELRIAESPTSTTPISTR